MHTAQSTQLNISKINGDDRSSVKTGKATASDRKTALSILNLTNAPEGLLAKVDDQVLVNLAKIHLEKNQYAGKTYEIRDPEWADAITSANIPLTTYAIIRTSGDTSGPTLGGLAPSFDESKLALLSEIDHFVTARVSRDSILAVAGCSDVLAIQ